MQITHLNSESK